MNEEDTEKFSHLENINVKKDNFVNNIREVQSELNDEPHNEKTKTNECTIKIIKNYPNNGTMGNEIQCIHCKNIFKSQEIFENHKILCDEGETVIEKEKETNNNLNNKESNGEKVMNFQFIGRTCNICHEHFESEKHFDEHKLSYCKFLQEEHYQVSSKTSTSKKQSNSFTDFCNVNNIPPIDNNKKRGHCDLIYNTKKELLNHIMECHEGQLLFKCIICDRVFEKWSSIDIHEATHRIDKPYLCDLCGKSFKHSNNLRGHKRTHLDDSKKKRHVCDICGNAFRSR